MGHVLINPDRSWTAASEPLVSNSLPWLHQQLGPTITDLPVYSSITMWLSGPDGRHHCCNPLATLLITALNGPHPPLFGAAVLTAVTWRGNVSDLSKAQLEGLTALLRAMADSPQLDQLEQAGAVFSSILGGW